MMITGDGLIGRTAVLAVLYAVIICAAPTVTQIGSLDRHGFDARANQTKGFGKLTEAMVGLACFGDLFSNV